MALAALLRVLLLLAVMARQELLLSQHISKKGLMNKESDDLIVVPAEDRTLIVPYESHVIYVPAEWRTIEVPSHGNPRQQKTYRW